MSDRTQHRASPILIRYRSIKAEDVKAVINFIRVIDPCKFPWSDRWLFLALLMEGVHIFFHSRVKSSQWFMESVRCDRFGVIFGAEQIQSLPSMYTQHSGSESRRVPVGQKWPLLSQWNAETLIVRRGREGHAVIELVSVINTSAQNIEGSIGRF